VRIQVDGGFSGTGWRVKKIQRGIIAVRARPWRRPDNGGVLLLLLGLWLAAAAGVRAEDYLYTTNDGAITITNYTGAGGAVSVPATLNGLPVTGVGDAAFANCTSLTDLALPASVTNLGEWVFYACTSLTSVTLPAGLPSLGTGLFYGCTNLGAITIPAGATNIGESAFDSCAALASVIIPDAVLSLGDTAFEYCTGLTNVTLGAHVASLGAGVFNGCLSLGAITLPASVTSIGIGPFSYCPSLAAITVAASNACFVSVDEVLFDHDQATLIQCPGARAGAYTVPADVTNIADWAFSSGSGLTSITLPAGVTRLGDYAFESCTALVAVYFRGAAPDLGGDNVFSGDAQVTVYYLPDTGVWPDHVAGRPAILWNPQVLNDAALGVMSGQFGFAIGGSSGVVVVVEACTNLLAPAWVPVGTNALTGGASYFGDPAWTNYPCRFYRLRGL